MSTDFNRRWFVVYELGSTEPRYLISTLSIVYLDKWLKDKLPNGRVMLAKVWQLVKVFSGMPYHLPTQSDFAPNEFDMVNEQHLVTVVILD